MSLRPLVLDAFLPYRLSYTANVASEVIASSYEALFGLNIPEWRIIAVVAEGASEGVTQQAIVATTRMDKVTVSRAAIALSNRGLIERKPNPGDGRSRLLVLTREGWELYAAVAPKALELEAQVFSSFTRDELTAFVAMLRRIDAAALGMMG